MSDVKKIKLIHPRKSVTNEIIKSNYAYFTINLRFLFQTLVLVIHA